jgi:Flp pilus assembly pilin Flp
VTPCTTAALPNLLPPGRFPCLRNLVHDERGQDLIEYALIAATIGLGTVAGVNGIASSVSQYVTIVRVAFDASLAGHS